MKFLIKASGLFSLFLLSTFATIGQKADVDVYEKKDGDKTTIIARNTGKSEYKVRITITSEGMDVSPSPVVEASVPGGFMKEMATLSPRPGETWSYSYEVSISQTVSKPAARTPETTTAQANTQTGELKQAQERTAVTTPSLSGANIILYAKPGCGRCTFARKQLNSHGIPFEEINTQSESPEVSHMWAQMRSQGFKGGSVTMPVIRVNGQYHYDIKDIEVFIVKLKGS